MTLAKKVLVFVCAAMLGGVAAAGCRCAFEAKPGDEVRACVMEVLEEDPGPTLDQAEGFCRRALGLPPIPTPTFEWRYNTDPNNKLLPEPPPGLKWKEFEQKWAPLFDRGERES